MNYSTEAYGILIGAINVDMPSVEILQTILVLAHSGGGLKGCRTVPLAYKPGFAIGTPTRKGSPNLYGHPTAMQLQSNSIGP